MKTLKLVGIAIVLFLATTARAQVSVNVNIGTPPLWGPIGYTDVRYYYLPDIETYYDIQTGTFIYIERGIWIRRGYLPFRYRDYDLYGGYKVIVPRYRGPNPHFLYNYHRSNYKKGYHGRPQKTYGNNPRHNEYKGNNAPRGNYKGNNAPKGNYKPNGNNAPRGNYAPRGNSPKGNYAPKGNNKPKGKSAPGGNQKGKGGGKGKR